MPRPAWWPKRREAASAGAAPATRSAHPAWPCPPAWPGRQPACAAARHPPWPGKAPARPAGHAAATPRPPEADCGHEAAALWPCSAAGLRHKPVSGPSARPSRLPGCVRTVSRFGLQRLGRRDGRIAGMAGNPADRRSAWRLHAAATMTPMTDFTSHSCKLPVHPLTLDGIGIGTTSVSDQDDTACTTPCGRHTPSSASLGPEPPACPAHRHETD